MTEPRAHYTAALAAWNTRPAEDALRARIAELEAQWASRRPTMIDDYGNETAADWGQAIGLFDALPRYVPAPAQHVTGAKLIVVFDGDKLHISRAGSGTPVETIALPAGMRLCREVQ